MCGTRVRVTHNNLADATFSLSSRGLELSFQRTHPLRWCEVCVAPAARGDVATGDFGRASVAQNHKVMGIVNKLVGQFLVERPLLHTSTRSSSARVEKPCVHDDNANQRAVNTERPIVSAHLLLEH
jgi:hypothetical protein